MQLSTRHYLLKCLASIPKSIASPLLVSHIQYVSCLRIIHVSSLYYYSSQSSRWWAMMDLNHRPRHYQCRALTPELIARNDLRNRLPAAVLRYFSLARAATLFSHRSEKIIDHGLFE